MRASDILEEYNGDFYIELNLNLNNPNAKESHMVKVPVYKFIEKFLWIMNKDGERIRFILNEDQVELYKEICIQRRKKMPVRINILKARQIGFSTFIAAIIFVCTLFKKGQNATVVADIADHASGLFDKYKFFYDNLPQELQMPLIKSNAKQLSVRYADKTTSTIKIAVQGDASGRGSTNQYLHLSECAFWKDLKNTVISLQSTVSTTNQDSIIFYETTANGMNAYKDMWDKAVGGESIFKPLFYAWWGHPQYQDRWYEDWEMEDWERDIQNEHGLTLEQMAWYHKQYLEFSKDKEKLKQEYPSNPIEAFITSGNSVFNSELVQKRKMEVLKNPPKKRGRFIFNKVHSSDGGQIQISNIKFLDTQIGEIKIYEEPIVGMPYVVNNDPAMGGEDFYAIQVFNNYTGKQVAVYHKNKCDADDCAYQMYCLGKYYNDALISGETNTTAYLLQVCQKCGYKFIYQDQDIEEIGTRFFNKLGYKTKTNNRQTMIDLFKIAFREDYTIINDYETLCEMENFQVVRNESTGKEKIEASGNSHDDLVMAACGFYLCRHMQLAIYQPNAKKENNQKIFDPFAFTQPTDQVQGVYQVWD